LQKTVSSILKDSQYNKNWTNRIWSAIHSWITNFA